MTPAPAARLDHITGGRRVPKAEWWPEDYPVAPGIGYANGAADENPVASLLLPDGSFHDIMPLRRRIGFHLG